VSIVRLTAAEIVPIVIGFWLAELPRPRWVPWFAVLAAGVAGVLLIQLDLALFSLAFFVFGLVLGLIFRRVGRGSVEADKAGPVALLVFIGFAVGVGMLLFAARDRPFVPAERLTDRDGGTIAGYVLGTSGDSLVILGEEPRYIYIRKESEIASRQPCQFDPVDSRTIFHLLFGLSASLHDDCDDPRLEKRSWPATEPSGSPR
jgi:hypothetical protein